MGVFRKFSRLMDEKQKKKIVFLFFITVIGAFLEILGVSLMIPLLSAIMDSDIINTNTVISWVCGLLGINSHKNFVLVCVFTLIAVFVFKDLFLMFQTYVQTRFVCNNRFATMKKLFHAYINRPYEYYLSASSGEIVRVVQNDTLMAYRLFSTLLVMLSESIVSVALIITIFVIDWQMTTFVAIMMGMIILVISKGIKPIMKKAGRERLAEGASTNKWLLQGISGIKEIKVSNTERFFEENFETSGRKLIHAIKVDEVLNNVPKLLIEMVSVCSMLILIAIEIFLGRDIESLIPAFGAFAMAAIKLMPNANRIVNSISSISYNMSAVDKLLEQLDTLPKCKENVISDERREEKGVELAIDKTVELCNITYQYPNSEKKILDDASMVIPVGKSVGVIGTSGAGKTTAVDIMIGLLEPKEGKVLVDGVDIMKDYRGWLSHIGYIPQMIFMLDSTIRSNVAFGVNREEIDDDRVWHCLEEAQLAEFVRTLPKGLDTVIGERGMRVSGGQRQRIGIARALYGNPDLLLFDEATSALDTETEAAVMESINSLHGKKTMVIIAHRKQTIEGCDIVYRVKDGKIICEKQ